MNTNTKRIKKCALKALRRRLEVLATPITFAVTSFVSLCCFCQSATASDAPLAYDGFNYTLNQTLLGQGTDAGWASSGQTYTISAGDGTGAHSEVSDMTPYLNLETSGNQLNLLGASAPGGASGVYRNLGTTYNTANNDYWFSALLQLDTTAGNSYAG
ncbi:MAG: hypothetical protein NTZ01_06275, partial [Verrucomicrobia bacterium]|nr:hypothetical protein [Verrucomicrobiota bacterium]